MRIASTRYIAGWLGLAALTSWFACGVTPKEDDDSSSNLSSSGVASGGAGGAGTASSASSSASGSSSSSSGSSVGGASASSSGAGGSSNCPQVCTTLYQCGLSNGNCPGFVPADQQLFLDGTMNDGCIAQCMAQPALAALVDGNDCPGTITTLSAVSPDFECVCTYGVTSANCL